MAPSFLSFRRPDGLATWGVDDGDRVYDLGSSGHGLAQSLRSAIELGVLHAAGPAGPSFAVDEVTHLPVIPDPGKIVCVGSNYRDHRDEAGRPAATHPTVFLRFADTQVGHGAAVKIPSVTECLDYEGELACVIGAPASQVPADRALSVVAGFSCYNDFSVRDWQRHTTQCTPGKNFPGTGAFGPALVPMRHVDNFDSIELITRVNDEVRQRAHLGDMLFGLPALIEYITAFTPLAPGDVIVTGTPGGVGLFMDPPQFLRPGDRVAVEIGPLGLLRNNIVA